MGYKYLVLGTDPSITRKSVFAAVVRRRKDLLDKTACRFPTNIAIPQGQIAVNEGSRRAVSEPRRGRRCGVISVCRPVLALSLHRHGRATQTTFGYAAH